MVLSADNLSFACRLFRNPEFKKINKLPGDLVIFSKSLDQKQKCFFSWPKFSSVLLTTWRIRFFFLGFETDARADQNVSPFFC